MSAPVSFLATRRGKQIAIVSAVAFLLSVVVFLVWAGRSLTAARVDRWLPARPGDAVVLGKARAEDKPVLMVRVEVPEAVPAEAALLPAAMAGRTDMVQAKTFDATVPVTEDQWRTIEAGARIRAMYQINARRSEIFVTGLYLDKLGK
jgi:hypothetical protein